METLNNLPSSSVDPKIRNINQSVQSRDVIKQASDIIVYIDGQNYMVNPYLGQVNDINGRTVPFNDFVNSWSSTYDTDTMIPSGNLTLTVPTQLEYLFRVPGGNSILRTMAEIRVFAKGYYFSARGNTVYRQIFRGFISSITYVPNGTMLNITLSCFGALGILEKMQIDQQPGIMSSTPYTAIPFTSSTWNLNPYQQIAWVFIYASMIDGFTMESLLTATMNRNNPYFDAVDFQYVAKWQALLYDLSRDVHIFGTPKAIDIIKKIRENLKETDGYHTPMWKEAMGIAYDHVGTYKESDQNNNSKEFYAQLRGYMPDMGFASVNLFNGRCTSRLERLRYVTSLIGFECYQDVDGAIVVKPPLYNLDVTNLDNQGADTALDPSLSWITAQNNPFIVQLSEILTESETEDEAGVRMTRVLARGSYSPSIQWTGSKDFLATAEDIDFPKLAQFGLRTEPPREANWFQDGDDKAIFAFAASEMARANRGYRHYTVTVPLRPEIRLGFPVYFPHKDIYGYVKSVSMTWNRGQSAQTQITVDSLRRRPLFPETQSVPNGANQQPSQTMFMTEQPNLITQWTKVQQTPAAPATPGQSANAAPAVTPTPASTASAAATKLENQLASLPVPQRLIVSQQLQMLNAMKNGGANYLTNPSDTTNCWRIQPDTAGTFSKPNRALDNTYYDDLQSKRPYTDQDGYELVGPFPWGRWKSLKDSLTLFTIDNTLGSNAPNAPNPAIKPINPNTEQLTDASAFLFAGDSASAVQQTAEQLVSTLVNQATVLNDFKSFELVYTDTPTQTQGMAPTLSASAPESSCTVVGDDVVTARADTMLTGQQTQTDLFTSILSSIHNDPNVTIGK
jgi:hypothetical protein